MNDEQLKRFGFINFIHLSPKSRDEQKRMVWSGVYRDQLISIRIIFSEDQQSWSIDNIACDFMDEKLDELLRHNSVDSILEFIKLNSAEPHR